LRKPYKSIKTLEDLLKCSEEKENGCLEWKYNKLKRGYGKVRYEGVEVLVHRLSYKFTNPNEDITNLDICHSCDNPPCINPNHLFSATHRENMEDMKNKGRENKPGPNNPRFGDSHPNKKLTYDEVHQIRKIYSEVKITQRALAERFNISFQQISRILNNRRWRKSREE